MPNEPKAKVAYYAEIPAEKLGEEAPGATLRWLIDEEPDGAPVYALRLVEIDPGGHSPDHTHPYEHENFVLEGKGRVMIAGEWHDIGPGYVVFVPPGVRHQYQNAGEVPLRFLCGIPVSKLREK